MIWLLRLRTRYWLRRRNRALAEIAQYDGGADDA